MISQKLTNLCDQLWAHAESGQLDRETFNVAVNVLRALAEEAAALERATVCDDALLDGPAELRDAIEAVRAQFDKFGETGLTMEAAAVRAFVQVFAGWCEIIDRWGVEEPPARRHANDPGVIDFCEAQARREGARFLARMGLHPSPGDAS